jgi:copper(I)-binding protein
MRHLHRSQLHRTPFEWRTALGLAAIALAMLAAAGTPPITVTAAWIRWLPGSLPAGGYLTLRNDGDRALTLTSLTSPDYGSLMLHRSRMQGQVSTMEAVPQLVLPPHQSLSFATQGYHIMLEQSTRPLQPGDHVTITLHFADRASLPVSFEVRSADTAPPP